MKWNACSYLQVSVNLSNVGRPINDTIRRTDQDEWNWVAPQKKHWTFQTWENFPVNRNALTSPALARSQFLKIEFFFFKKSTEAAGDEGR